jgi:hypothetical protein
MPADIADEKQLVHEMIDRVAPKQVAAVRSLLDAMLDPEEDDRVTEDDPDPHSHQASLAGAARWQRPSDGTGSLRLWP